MSASPVLDFLEFVEGQKDQTLQGLVDKVLQKSRLMTKAEAGTIFITRRRGNQRRRGVVMFGR